MHTHLNMHARTHIHTYVHQHTRLQVSYHLCVELGNRCRIERILRQRHHDPRPLVRVMLDSHEQHGLDAFTGTVQEVNIFVRTFEVVPLWDEVCHVLAYDFNTGGFRVCTWIRQEQWERERKQNPCKLELFQTKLWDSRVEYVKLNHQFKHKCYLKRLAKLIFFLSISLVNFPTLILNNNNDYIPDRSIATKKNFSWCRKTNI